MSHIAWTDVLDIGLPQLDDQHKKLITLSNSLIQAMAVGKGADVLQLLFEELKGYTAYHFEDEERYMEQIGYPDLDEHKALHIELINQVDEFRKKLLGSGVSPDHALDFINEWIIKHIMDEDVEIGKFARTQ